MDEECTSGGWISDPAVIEATAFSLLLIETSPMPSCEMVPRVASALWDAVVERRY